MKPTDDELEAMAQVMQGVAQEKRDANWCNDAAAMLRACKTGDAPDHAEWDAAIEAAAKVALDQDVACSNWFMQTGHHCNVYEQLPIVAAGIRALKKGQTND